MYCTRRILNYSKVYFDVYLTKNSLLSDDKSYIMVLGITNTLQITSLYPSYIPFVNVCFCKKSVSLPARLLVVLCRMFSNHMSLEARRYIALLVAVFTGKGLLTSVRGHVLF